MAARTWHMLAQDRRIRWGGGLLVAAIVVGLIAAWLSRGEFKGKYALPQLGADKSVAAAQPVTPVAKPVPALNTAPPAQAQPAPPPPPPMVAEEDGPPDTMREDADDSTRMARAIEKAARKALDRGAPVHWHKAGEEGYVVVSDVRDYGDRACRNVSATIDRDDDPAQSSSHLWCTTPEGDWAPAD